jgi:choice-of-anchor A domain-containing protein
MMRTSLNWAISLCVVAYATACGSSGDKTGVGAGSSASVGGTSYTSLGGNGPNAGNGNNGGSSGVSGSGSNGGQGPGDGGAGNAGSGNGGDNPNAGTGAISGNGGGENGGNGGDNPNGGSGNDTSIPTAGSSSKDVLNTGGESAVGGGTSIDVSTGGGISIDVPTGGGVSIDVPTGGGNSVDVPTGGGNSVDVPTGGGSSVDVPTGGAPSFDVLNCTKTVLSEINVYVIKDATPSGADTEGNMYVGGNLTATSTYSVGAKDVGVDCSKYALVVGGNATNVKVVNGKGAVGGTVSGSSEAPDCGWLARGSTLPVDFATLEVQVEALSIKMSQLPVTNCTVSKNAANETVLTATDPKLSVCKIDVSQLTNIHVDYKAGSAVIVNVSGTTVSNWNGSVFLNGNANDSDQATNVVWNFYEATSITFGGIAVQGSVLAPLATIESGSGGHVAGQVIVKYLKGNTEYHPYYFDACITWPTSL